MPQKRPKLPKGEAIYDDINRTMTFERHSIVSHSRTIKVVSKINVLLINEIVTMRHLEQLKHDKIDAILRTIENT